MSPYDLTQDGGVQAQVLGLAGWLRSRGDEVRLIAPSLPEGEPGASVGRVTRIRANRSVAPISLSNRVAGRVSEAMAWGEVAHIHEPLMPRVGPAALRARGPKVVTFHADPPAWVKRLYRVLGPWMRALQRHDVMVTAVSRQASGALPSGWGPERIVPNGIDVSFVAEAVERRRGRVVFLGRDEPRKGLSLLLEAWPEIKQRHAHAELVVMGAERPDPPEGVVFLGRVTEEVKERTMRSAEAYVAPNLGGESFGIVLVEAMTAGCAVVASDLLSFQDVVGNTASLFKTGSVAALVDRVAEVLGDAALAGRMSIAGQERAARFAWNRVGPAYRECYEQVLNQS